jgi:hypothetical protein
VLSLFFVAILLLSWGEIAIRNQLV